MVGTQNEGFCLDPHGRMGLRSRPGGEEGSGQLHCRLVKNSLCQNSTELYCSTVMDIFWGWFFKIRSRVERES